MAECCTNIVSFQPFVERTVSKLNSHMEAFFFLLCFYTVDSENLKVCAYFFSTQEIYQSSIRESLTVRLMCRIDNDIGINKISLIPIPRRKINMIQVKENKYSMNTHYETYYIHFSFFFKCCRATDDDSNFSKSS